jgi:energy-coupling factor transporter ATP-binding protein EcfA2
MILRDLTHRYPGPGGFTLGPIRHEGPDDRPWLILGPTGSGKTTLLRLLAGGLRPSGGALEGAEPAAYLPQLPERALAGRNLAEDLCGDVRPSQALRARLRHALARVGLDGIPLSRRSRRLSAGERRRLALALLLLSGHRHWALDEPEAGLDAAGTGRLLEVLTARARAHEGRMWIATHRFELYASLRPWVLVLDQGGLLGGGEAPSVYAEPALAGALSLSERAVFRVWERLRARSPELGALTAALPAGHPLAGVHLLLRERAGLR